MGWKVRMHMAPPALGGAQTFKFFYVLYKCEFFIKKIVKLIALTIKSYLVIWAII